METRMMMTLTIVKTFRTHSQGVEEGIIGKMKTMMMNKSKTRNSKCHKNNQIEVTDEIKVAMSVALVAALAVAVAASVAAPVAAPRVEMMAVGVLEVPTEEAA